MEQIDALCPAIHQLQEAALTRKRVRFDRDYTSQPNYKRTVGNLSLLINLAKVLNLHAIAALSENKPEVALSDIELTLQLSKGVAQEPILVSGLISINIITVQISSIWEGLNRHAWSAQQLSELQKCLQEIDFISAYQLCVRGEAMGFFAQTNDWMRKHRKSATQLMFDPGVSLWGNDNDPQDHKVASCLYFIVWLIPSGWFDMSKARGVTLYNQVARELVDPVKHRIDTEKVDQFIQKLRSLSPYDFPDVLMESLAPSVVDLVEHFAQGQFRVDAAALACALERYRLEKGFYPPTLRDLPEVQFLPTDPFSGESYHYKLLLNKNYLLYSVGWNQTNEGGKLVYYPDFHNGIDWRHGDWVWSKPWLSHFGMYIR